jgi:hypothetical protein
MKLFFKIFILLLLAFPVYSQPPAPNPETDPFLPQNKKPKPPPPCAPIDSGAFMLLAVGGLFVFYKIHKYSKQ